MARDSNTDWLKYVLLATSPLLIMLWAVADVFGLLLVPL